MRTDPYLHEEAAKAHLQRGALSNGVQWAMWPDERDSVVSVQVWVRTGSRDEERGRTGLAHMLEHLMFRGSEAVPDGAFDARMEDLGAQINAATWLDYTFYETTAAPAALEAVLELEADRFGGLALTEDVVTTEREVVANERRQVIDADPVARLQEHFQHLAFGDGCYGWPTIGWAEDIAAYSLEDVQRFFASRYDAGRLCVCLAGRLDPLRVPELLQASFGRLRPAGPPSRRPETSGAGASGWHELRLPMAQDRILMGLRVPGRDHADWPAYLLLQMALGGTEAARLPLRLEVEKEFVLHVGTSLHGHALPHLLEISAQLRSGREGRAVRSEVLAELADLAEGGLRSDERERLLDALEIRASSALARSAVRCEQMGEGWAVADSVYLGFEQLSRVREVDDATLRRCAAQLLDDAAHFTLHGIGEGSREAAEGQSDEGPHVP